MDNIYPTPQQAGIRNPSHLIKDRFCAGFMHGLKGGHLHEVEYLRLSFREGFRAAKLYLREVRHSRGILDLPVRWKRAHENHLQLTRDTHEGSGHMPHVPA